MPARKTADQWFAEYGESHQDDINELIHWICVPIIFWCVLGFIWSIPVPASLAAAAPWFRWTYAVAVPALIFYVRLSPPLSVGLTLFIAASCALLAWHEHACPFALWKSCLVLFVLAWIGQFIGHRIEGKKPSFLNDIVFLLIGPAWLLSMAYKKFGLRY